MFLKTCLGVLENTPWCVEKQQSAVFVFGLLTLINMIHERKYFLGFDLRFQPSFD